MEKGYIVLSRTFFDNVIWQAARAFSEGEALLDLIQSARFESSPITSCIGVYQITWSRGQYPASVRFLAKKWGRSEQWVKTCLGKFKRLGIIDTNNDQGMNVISLKNYDKYNKFPCNTPINTPNQLNDNELQGFVTHLATHPNTLNEMNDSELQGFVTHPQNESFKKQHTSNPKTNKGEINNIISLEGACAHAYAYEEEKNLYTCKSMLHLNEAWAEQCTMNFRLAGHKDFDLDKFHKYIDLFFIKLQNEGISKKSVSNAMQHFARWLAIELKKDANGPGKDRRMYETASERSDREREERRDEASQIIARLLAEDDARDSQETW